MTRHSLPKVTGLAAMLTCVACGDRTALTVEAVAIDASAEAGATRQVPFMVGRYLACQVTECRQGSNVCPTTGFVPGATITVAEGSGSLSATFGGPLATGTLQLDAKTDHTARVIDNQTYTLRTKAYTAPWSCTKSSAVDMTVTSGSVSIAPMTFGCNSPALTLTVNGDVTCGKVVVIFLCCDAA